MWKNQLKTVNLLCQLSKNGHYGPFLEKRHTEYFLICHFGESLGCLEIPHHWFSCWKTRPKKPPWELLIYIFYWTFLFFFRFGYSKISIYDFNISLVLWYSRIQKYQLIVENENKNPTRIRKIGNPLKIKKLWNCRYKIYKGLLY